MKLKQTLHRLLFPLIGFGALVWFLIRVIPKPSRATYPCMRVAYPAASGFVIYLLGLAATTFAIGKVKEHWKNSRFWALAGSFTIALVVGFITFQANKPAVYANTFSINTANTPNAPIGVAKGIFPGRVVWVHDTSAVNQNCVVNAQGHGWFMSENMNQPVIDSMLSSALHSISGKTSDSAAWNAIFQFHNNTRGKGYVNYIKGEKIFIKTIATSAWGGEFNTSDLSVVYNSYYGVSETSEATVLAVLKQLVNVVGVAQSDIYIGDPLKHIYKHLYDVWHGQFPNVHYLDNSYSTLGREKVVPSSTAIIHYSDKGTVLRTNSMSSGVPGDPVLQNYLYTIFETAEYVLNIPQLKGHQRAGMTMFSKNHLGSQVPASDGNADYLHMGLVRPYGVGDTSTLMRSNYGMYRVQVDLMTDSLLSGKNLLYIMDALWATDYELDKPLKWKMPPFNNIFTSSIFVSQDPVAIESVGYDFLRSEFTNASTQDVSVQMPAVDDYLHQAADSTNWRAGIKYDPNNTGVHVFSLGVHEHWNNAVNKQYTRNLGTGNGIELITIDGTLPVELQSFVCRISGNTVTLNWKTATEVTNYGFNIERRSIGTNMWVNIGFVQGIGTSNAPHNYTFIDTKLSAGTYAYRLKQIDNSGAFKYSQESEVIIEVPFIFTLGQNFPNPFNPSTQIDFSIPRSSHVTLKIYDVLGKEVATLVEGARVAGTYTATWNAQNYPSGIYFYRFKAGSYTMTRKLILLR